MDLGRSRDLVAVSILNLSRSIHYSALWPYPEWVKTDLLNLQKKLSWVILLLCLVPIFILDIAKPYYWGLIFEEPLRFVSRDADWITRLILFVAAVISFVSIRKSENRFLPFILPVAYVNHVFTFSGLYLTTEYWRLILTPSYFFNRWIQNEWVAGHLNQNLAHRLIWRTSELLLLFVVIGWTTIAIKQYRRESSPISPSLKKQGGSNFLVICPHCHKNQPKNNKFCSDCGTRVTQTGENERRFCRACGSSVRKNGKRCLNCGNDFELSSVTQEIFSETVERKRFELVFLGTLAAIVIFVVVKSAGGPESIDDEKKNSPTGRWIKNCYNVENPNYIRGESIGEMMKGPSQWIRKCDSQWVPYE
jgi:hypothetical protein